MSDDFGRVIACNCYLVIKLTGSITVGKQVIYPGDPPLSGQICVDIKVECSEGQLGPQGGSAWKSRGGTSTLDYTVTRPLGDCKCANKGSRCACNKCYDATHTTGSLGSGWLADLYSDLSNNGDESDRTVLDRGANALADKAFDECFPGGNDIEECCEGDFGEVGDTAQYGTRSFGIN